MPLVNTTKPSDSYANTVRPLTGETWATIDTTWASETRTWAEIGSLLNNSSKVYGGLLWAASNLPWQMLLPWVDSGGITNITRPS